MYRLRPKRTWGDLLGGVRRSLGGVRRRRRRTAFACFFNLPSKNIEQGVDSFIFGPIEPAPKGRTARGAATGRTSAREHGQWVLRTPLHIRTLVFSAQPGSKNPGFVLRPLSPDAIASLGVACKCNQSYLLPLVASRVRSICQGVEVCG